MSLLRVMIDKTQAEHNVSDLTPKADSDSSIVDVAEVPKAEFVCSDNQEWPSQDDYSGNPAFRIASVYLAASSGR